MKSKTIILSSTNKNGRGILTIYEENEILECRLRLYNIPNLSRYCKLGIYHNNEVFSANLLEKNGTYLSSMVGNFNIDKDFYSAIIDTNNNNAVILSGGTYSGCFVQENDIENKFNSLKKENPNTNLFEYDDELPADISLHNDIKPHEQNSKSYEQIEKESCETEDCSMCKNCKYKEFFYSNQTIENTVDSSLDSLVLNNTTDIIEKTKKDSSSFSITNNNQREHNISHSEHTSCHSEQSEESKKEDFINNIIPQFKYVFENYPQDETLNNLIENSKFVKINEQENQYSIGAIYNDNKLKYICYATLRNYNSPTPEEIGEHYQWLPLDKDDPLSDGYYVVFQDAEDLKIVEI